MNAGSSVPSGCRAGRRRNYSPSAEKGTVMFCNSCNNNGTLWLIILIIILFGWNGCGCGCENNCGGNCGCGC